MQRSVLLLLLLVSCCLTLTGFVLREDSLRGRDGAKSALAVLFGDGRRLFANHFLAKADAYFHRGRYPSVFEMAERERGNHLVESLGDEPQEPPHVHGPDCDHDHEEAHVHGPDCDHPEESGTDAASEPGDAAEHEHDEACAHAEPAAAAPDWIARLAGRFKPDQHVHLEQGGEREMLPWVKLAVEMDPHNVDAYTVGGYWLRQMGKSREAEAFLREGQRSNPESSEIYFELGRLHELEGDRVVSARGLYLLSLEKWNRANQGVEERDTIALAQILGRLGSLEEKQGELEAALYYYRLLHQFSPTPDAVQKLIDSVQGRLAETQAPATPL